MESQTPPGPKPPSPQQPPSKPDTVWISPRLREKLSDPDAGEPKEGPSPWIGIVLAVLVIGGGIGLFVSMRAGVAKEKAAAEEQARVAAAAAAADSIAAAARADSMRLAKADSAGAQGASAAGGAATSSGKPAPVATARPTTPASAPKPATTPTPVSAGAGGAAAPAAPKVVEKGPFGLDVGTFLVEERAASEQARLAEATGLPGRVITRNEDGGDVYHVVLGSFATRAAAERRAEALVAKGQVNQARPVSLAP